MSSSICFTRFIRAKDKRSKWQISCAKHFSNVDLYNLVIAIVWVALRQYSTCDKNPCATDKTQMVRTCQTSKPTSAPVWGQKSPARPSQGRKVIPGANRASLSHLQLNPCWFVLCFKGLQEPFAHQQQHYSMAFCSILSPSLSWAAKWCKSIVQHGCV